MFRVLGPLAVESDDGPIEIPGDRPRALLTALLLQPNAVVSADRLVDIVWGDDGPDRPTNALHQLVARLRSRLGPLAEHLQTSPGGYTLAASEESLDAHLFETLWRRARDCAQSDPSRSADLLDEALALWRGTAFAELADGVARPASVRLEELRLTALEDRAALHLAAGTYADAVATARNLIAADSLRERPVELLMRALHASGRSPEALEVFRTHRERLAEDLGLDPSADLRSLETRILQDGLGRPTPTVARPVAPPSLPWRASELLGRESELEQLRTCLAEQRLVTLVGPGGVGKTRLALEATHLLSDDGSTVWWADVTTVPAERLLDTLAEACGTENPRGPDPVDALARSLRTTPGLLVADNAESLLDELAPVVERLVASVPELRVLATSRERLAVGAEHVHLLAPLPLPSGPDPDNPAIRLFLDRANGFETRHVTQEDLELIAELCRRLDGLPLAIELGAARAPAFGLREFSTYLDQGIDLLSGGRRTAAARHRTLRAVVDASYALLGEDEALLLARLTVFPGPFTLEQVRAVCADDALDATAVAQALARLVDQSMVQAGEGRFWLLETLRTYAAERLDDTGRQSLRVRHARRVATRLRAMSWQQAPGTEPEVVAALARMSPDLHLAWEHAVVGDRDLAVELAADIYDFAYARQRRDLLEWGLVVAEWDVDHPDLPRALATAATAAWADGDLAEAERLANRGLGAGHGPNDPRTARSMVQSANLAMFAGRQDEAMDRFDRAGALYAAAGEHVQSLMTRMSVCQAMSYAGRTAEAAARMRELLASAQAIDNPTAISWAHYVTGETLSRSDPAAAIAAYHSSAEEGRRSDNRLFVMLAHSARVTLTAHEGEPGEALRELDSVLGQWSDLRNEAAVWGVLAVLVPLLMRVGHLREAAILATVVRENRDRQPLWERNEPALLACLAQAEERFGEAEAQHLVATGAGMAADAAVAHARRAIRHAQDELTTDTQR